VSRDLALGLVYKDDVEFGLVTPHLSADPKLLKSQPNPSLKLDMAKFVVLYYNLAFSIDF
jgi:hypothetical protein